MREEEKDELPPEVIEIIKGDKKKVGRQQKVVKSEKVGVMETNRDVIVTVPIDESSKEAEQYKRERDEAYETIERLQKELDKLKAEYNARVEKEQKDKREILKPKKPKEQSGIFARVFGKQPPRPQPSAHPTSLLSPSDKILEHILRSDRIKTEVLIFLAAVTITTLLVLGFVGTFVYLVSKVK